MVSIGNPGNAPDTVQDVHGTGEYFVGSVDHVYRIGKYEVSAGQYTEFLNAVAKTDPNGLYSAEMANSGTPSFGANIQRSGSAPNYSYSIAADWSHRPVNFVSFWDAVRFTNWLHNGQPIGSQGPGTTEDGAYHDVGNQTLFGRNAGARFFVPTEDEWYKPAYHNSDAGLASNYFDFPTGSNSFPGTDITEATNPGNNANSYPLGPYYRTAVGEFELSESPYGTFDQGGNVMEWNESVLSNSPRIRGGSFAFGLGMTRFFISDLGDPMGESNTLGFRVAGIAQPGDRGDFNHDGFVNAADYVVWRKSGGTQADYDVWRGNFGGTFSGIGSGTEYAVVPEPSTALSVTSLIICVLLACRQAPFRNRV